jgi:hypothetical protein
VGDVFNKGGTRAVFGHIDISLSGESASTSFSGEST